MTTLFTFIGVIAVFMIGKFIYDTYLSNNTEKDWQAYKKVDSHDAKVLENNKGLNFKTDYSVRKDGLYIYRHRAYSQHGEPIALDVLLIFNKKNRVIKAESNEPMDIDNSAIVGVLENVSEMTDIDNETAEYFCEKGKLNMEFKNGPGSMYEYTGSVLKDGLLLTIKTHYYDVMREGISTKTIFEDVKFNFIKAV